MTRAIHALLLLAATASFAGGGPQNVLVVMNERSPDSLELGHYYRERRGIPERNLCRVSVDPSSPDIPWPEFRARVLEPVNRHIEQQGLSNQVDFIVLCKDFPSRVSDNESVTAALFYGFHGIPGCPPCSMPTNTRSRYFGAERAFRRAAAGAPPGFLALLLTGSTLEEARAVADRGVAADGARPAGTFYLLKPPGDPARNVRFRLFDHFDQHARLYPGFPAYEFVNDNVIAGKKDVLGFLTGVPDYPDWVWTTNVFLPGAMADHFTSFGARLPDPPIDQATVMDWIRAGATASYGTVNEPCAYLEKFPNPMVYFWYGRGFCLAESYWMSVANPYQGLFVGEPLSAPFAVPATVRVQAPGAVGDFSGIVTVRVHAVAAGPDRPCAAVDAYVDDVFAQNLVTLRPAAGNRVLVRVEQIVSTYEIAEGDDLPAVAAGVAAAIRRQNRHLRAMAFGDRVLIWDGRAGKPGLTTPCELRVEPGTAAAATVGGRFTTPFFQESRKRARKTLTAGGMAEPGDALRCVITRPDGKAVTNEVRAAAKEPCVAVVRRMADRINGHPDLVADLGVSAAGVEGDNLRATLTVEARTPGSIGIQIQVLWEAIPARDGAGLDRAVAFTGRLQDNPNDLQTGAMIQLWCGVPSLPAAFVWDTRGVPDGAHRLRFVARDGTAAETQGHAVAPVTVRNSTVTCAIAGLDRGQTIPLGKRVPVSVVSTANRRQVLAWDLVVEGKRVGPLKGGNWVLDTRKYGPGALSVRGLVELAGGPSALSDPVIIRIAR
jgi:uncharacterized protein (TIGR03790 family)